MKFKLLLPLFLLFTLSVFSQGHKEKRDQVKALKVSYLTTELDLTSAEAAKFWPIYNSYEEKQFQIRHGKVRPLVRKLDETDFTRLADKEALAYLDQFEDAETDLYNLRKKLVADLKPVIGPVKLLKLKKAEDEFNKKLLHKYKQKKK